MQPQFPIYIVSKGRWETRHTHRVLAGLGVAHYLVIEEQEHDQYARHVDPAWATLLVLDPAYQEQYDTRDTLGLAKSVGPGPARNYAWDHATRQGHEWHWVMDDNINAFYRMHQNRKIRLGDGTGIRVMEDFTVRYANVAMAGPSYESLRPRRQCLPPFITNTRIYSCNLIRNDVPYRWRCRYNEDTDLSLRMLKDGWCTVQFNALLQKKIETQKVKGGNTAEFYAREGTWPKSRMLVEQHPDVARLMWRYGRVHHYVDYRPFKANRLARHEDAEIPDTPDDYGMTIRQRTT